MWPRADRVLIVASGPSLMSIRPDRVFSARAVVIAVNGAIDWLGIADYWFTLDPSAVNMRRACNPAPGARYVMAVPNCVTLPAHVARMNRVTGDLYDWVRAPGGLSDDPCSINTGNSAFGALNLAYHMRPDKIALLGVDGSQQRRVDGGMPRSLAHLPELFATACDQLDRAGIQVVNGSPESAVDCFERMTPDEAVEWLQR